MSVFQGVGRCASTLGLLMAASAAPSAIAGGDGHQYEVDRPDDHAPIGVMADHVHERGEWMLSYRYMDMLMESNYDGSAELAESEVLRSGTGRYMVAPTEMTMRMHMFGAMYAPSDKLTLMLMAPYVEYDMDHVTAMAGAFNTASNGLGDIKVSGLARVGPGVLRIGLSLPTGDLDARDDTPMGRSVLPYPMQLSSGTVDLLLGYTAVAQSAGGSVGGQISAVLRAGENDESYRLGNSVEGSLWRTWRVADPVSLSTRARYLLWGDVEGADPRYAMGLASNLVPTVDPDLRGGERFEVLVGINGLVAGHRLSAEIGVPVWQDLDGPQLGTAWSVTLGWQLAL
ncbi:MAG: hypothetical protein NXH85_09930 [Pseudomonadaceae bacterium]|nr:hypothetical protein [Pseudomonadaceae bacterium]